MTIPNATLSAIVACAALVPASSRLPAQAPAPLQPADFTMAGLHEGIDSATIAKQLGKPDSVVIDDASEFDPGAKLVTWVYPHFAVLFFSGAHVVGIDTQDPTILTARGLRVGDSFARLTRLYGQASGAGEGEYDYEDPHDHLHLMRVTIEHGRVTRIYVGRVLD